MSGQRRTELVMTYAAVATAAAAVADSYLLAALALAAAAASLAHLRGRDALAPAAAGDSPTPRRSPTPPMRPEVAAFHGFEGDDALLSDVPDEDQLEDEPDDDRTDDEHLVDDLTADLGSDDDISFLPPYVSGDGPRDDIDRGRAASVHWDPPPDSSLLALLNDVLEPSSKVPMPRRFALGTVALLRNLLQPQEVERILTEQKRYPRLRFGDIAVQLGVLNEKELEELLAAQEEGVFTDAEILDTRERLRIYHLESERRESA